MNAIDHRIQTFVRWYGQVPEEATPIEDFRARQHAATWIRRNIGDGVASTYAIGYGLGDCWWTLFFERLRAPTQGGVELWRVEAYDHGCKSWSKLFQYWPDYQRWRHALLYKSGRPPLPTR